MTGKKLFMLVFVSTSLISFRLLADDEGTCGTYCTWTFNSQTGLLSIHGEGAMTFNGWGARSWGNYVGQIQSVYVEKGITSIDSGAFKRASSLSSVTFEEGSKLESIGPAAFENTSLTNIDLPKNLKRIGYEAFAGISTLTDITLPDSIEGLGTWLFSGSSNIKSLNMPESASSIEESHLDNRGINYKFLGRSQIETLYCPIKSQDFCERFLEKARENDELPSNLNMYVYDKKGDYYYDEEGRVYSSLQNLSLGKDIKRIYTVEEAAAVVKPTGNTFKIRYR